MVRLSSQTEKRDALNVLAADRRELVLVLETARPLRKPRNATQRKAIARVREEAAKQLSEQLDAQARKAFRSRIAVELRLALPSGRHAAGLGPVIKDYIDLLVGIVVPDDAQVEHLSVLREPGSSKSAKATIRCLPISVFAAEYDRAFRVLGQGGASAAALRGPFSSAASGPTMAIDGNPVQRPAWGLDSFDEHARESLKYEESVLAVIDELDAQEEDQLEEDPDGPVYLDVPATYEEFEDWEVRSRVRQYLQETTGFALGDWLADQGFDARDRPGPEPQWLAEVVELDAADVAHLEDEGPGCVLLPPPPLQKTSPDGLSWPRLVTRELYRRLFSRRWYRARFRGPLALDIALRGEAGQHMDVDNVARTVVREFERVFEDAQPEVSGYRVYRKRYSSDDDVRVRIMPATRLEGLVIAMDDAREVMRANRSQRVRD